MKVEFGNDHAALELEGRDENFRERKGKREDKGKEPTGGREYPFMGESG